MRYDEHVSGAGAVAAFLEAAKPCLIFDKFKGYEDPFKYSRYEKILADPNAVLVEWFELPYEGDGEIHSVITWLQEVMEQADKLGRKVEVVGSEDVGIEVTWSTERFYTQQERDEMQKWLDANPNAKQAKSVQFNTVAWGATPPLLLK